MKKLITYNYDLYAEDLQELRLANFLLFYLFHISRYVILKAMKEDLWREYF